MPLLSGPLLLPQPFSTTAEAVLLAVDVAAPDPELWSTPALLMLAPAPLKQAAPAADGQVASGTGGAAGFWQARAEDMDTDLSDAIPPAMAAARVCLLLLRVQVASARRQQPAATADDAGQVAATANAWLVAGKRSNKVPTSKLSLSPLAC